METQNLLQAIIVELRTANDNISGIESGVSIISDDLTKIVKSIIPQSLFSAPVNFDINLYDPKTSRENIASQIESQQNNAKIDRLSDVNDKNTRDIVMSSVTNTQEIIKSSVTNTQTDIKDSSKYNIKQHLLNITDGIKKLSHLKLKSNGDDKIALNNSAKILKALSLITRLNYRMLVPINGLYTLFSNNDMKRDEERREFISAIMGLKDRDDSSRVNYGTYEDDDSDFKKKRKNKRSGSWFSNLLKGAAAIAALGFSLYPLAKVLKDIKGINALETLGLLAGSLVAIGTAGAILGNNTFTMLKGALAIAALGFALYPLVEVLEKFKNIDFDVLKTLGIALGGLLLAGGISGAAWQPLLIGAGVIAALGLALYPLAAAIEKSSPGLKELIGSLTVLKDIPLENLLAFGPAVGVISAGLVAFAAGSAVAGGIAMLSKFLGLNSPLDKFIELGKVAPEIKSLFEYFKNIKSLEDIFSNLNVDKPIEKIKSLHASFYNMLWTIKNLNSELIEFVNLNAKFTSSDTGINDKKNTANTPSKFDSFYNSIVKVVLPQSSEKLILSNPMLLINMAIMNAISDLTKVQNSTTSVPQRSMMISPLSSTNGSLLMKNQTSNNVLLNYNVNNITGGSNTSINSTRIGGENTPQINPFSYGSGYTGTY